MKENKRLFKCGVKFTADDETKMVHIELRAMALVGEFVEVFVPDYERDETEIKLVKITAVYHLSYKIEQVNYSPSIDAELLGELVE